MASTAATSARSSEKITSGERNIFARIAADAPLNEVLEAIAALIESVSSAYVVAIS